MAEGPAEGSAAGGAQLLDRGMTFVAALRRAGLPVSTAESVDATRAFAAVDLLDRASVREALAAALCKRPPYRRSFDTLFDLFFPARQGDGVGVGAGSGEGGAGSGEVAAGFGEGAGLGGESAFGGPGGFAGPGGAGGGGGGAPARALRERLRELLLEGDPQALARFAGLAVGGLGRADGPQGRQTFFAYRVLRALSADTLVAGLLEVMLAGAPRGGLAERVARETIRERIRAFEASVEAEVRRRLAEERGAEQVARTVARPIAEQVDFLRAGREDLLELRRAVYPLARRLATRLSARRRLGREGRLDFRRTVRASLATGGVPLTAYHRPKKTRKPELVVLCDVSGSVASFAHFTLMLTAALREQFTKVRAFAFIDSCDEVTRFFTPGSDLATAMSAVLLEAELVWFDGHSDYGHSFEVFTERYPDAVGPKTSLLILGDARNNYRGTAVPVLAGLTARARHSYWLNPEPRSYWSSGDSAAWAYEPVVDEMVECRNAEQLARFVTRLLPT